jgi:hypothetical protein
MLVSEEKAANDAGFSHPTSDGFNYDPKKMEWEGWMLVGNICDSLD